MKEKVLIIRSVSFQQLDKSLPVILKQFNNSEFYILTHSHGIENCKKYNGIKEVIKYPSKKNFSAFKTGKLNQEKFDNVVYLVSNVKGNGFLNVSLLAHRLAAESVYECNINSNIKKVSKLNTAKKSLSTSFIIPLTVIITAFLTPIVLLTLLIRNMIISDKS
jgi:hypothetical protein